jgi:hypothetical protein
MKAYLREIRCIKPGNPYGIAGDNAFYGGIICSILLNILIEVAFFVKQVAFHRLRQE